MENGGWRQFIPCLKARVSLTQLQMIDVIVSSRCSHCVEQKEIMDRYFFDDEYRIIDSGGEDFAGYKYASKIRAVPCIVVEDEDEELVYAGIGVHSEERLR